jgi:drug/metabolite transporter (DMT)-like permease
VPGFLPSLTAVLCWGAMFTVASTALDRVDAAHMTAIRYVAASAVFLALLAALEGGRALRPEGRLGRVALLGTAGFAGFNLLSFAALEHTSPEHASLVVAMTPLLTLLGRWITAGERPTRVQLGCVAVAFAGVALVITRGDPAALGSGGVGLGELMVLVGVICWVGYTLGAAGLPTWSPLRFTTLTATAGTVSIVALTALADALGRLAPPSPADVGAVAPQMLYVIVFGAVLGVIGWNAGVRRLGPANAALFMNLVPVTAFAIEAARGTRPEAVELAGAAITLAALVVANLAGRLPARDAAQERRDGAQEVVAARRGRQRVEVARAAAAVDEHRA